MSDREHELFLFDIIVAAAKIYHIRNQFHSAQELKYNFMAWDSVIREFEIIGEATNYLLKFGVISSNREVVDFRNLLIHAYFGIDEDEVWYIIEHHLPPYETFIQQIISTLPCKKRQNLIMDVLEENSHLPFITTKLKELACSQD